MPIRLLLAGYFGCGNLGDDAILSGFAYGVSGLDYELRLLSGAPEQTFRNYGIPSVPRKERGAVDQAISECDALIFPGGSIFQDVTSVASAGYYSTLARKAKKAGKKVVLLGQGVGPLKTFLGKRFAAAAFNLADGIVVRDPQSVQTLQSLGVKKTPRVGADMAFLLPQPQGNAEDFAVANMKAVGIAPRPWGKNNKATVKLFGDLARLLMQNGLMPVLIEMDRNEDGPLIQEISKIMGKVPDIRGIDVPSRMQERMARMDAIIAMRLHAGVLSANSGVPPFMVSYDPKVSAFAKMLDLPTAPVVEGLTGQRLYELFMSFYRDRERNLRSLERRREEMVKQARSNIDVLQQILPTAARSESAR